MKINSLVTLALLFVLSFSIVHEYVFALHESEHHTTVAEYISELEVPPNHNDVHDIHFEYHQAFLLSENTTLSKIEHNSFKMATVKESYHFQIYLNFLKPPIA